jgi:hypothetical protein
MKILEFFIRSLSIFNNDIYIFKDYDNIITDSLHKTIPLINENYNTTYTEQPCIFNKFEKYKYNDDFKLLKRDSLKYQKQVDVNILSLYHDHCIFNQNNNVIQNLILDNNESKTRWLQLRMKNNNEKLSKLEENNAYFKNSIDLEIKTNGLSKKLKKVENERIKYFEKEINETNDRIDLLRLKFNIIENIKSKKDLFSVEYTDAYSELFTEKRLYYNKILKEKKNCCCHKNP